MGGILSSFLALEEISIQPDSDASAVDEPKSLKVQSRDRLLSMDLSQLIRDFTRITVVQDALAEILDELKGEINFFVVWLHIFSDNKAAV